jgi:PAS domain S-box-containing protein
MAAPPLASLLPGLFADLPVGLALLDAEGRELYANARLEAMGGVPQAARALVDDVLARGAVPPAAEVRTAPPGARDVLVSVHPLRDEDGAVAGAGVALVDLTELRALERDRDEALALLDALFDAAPIGLGFWDRELRYRRVNAALAEINGVPEAEHVGRTLREVLPGIPDAVMEDFRKVIERAEPLLGMRVEGETPAQPGRTRTWSASYYPVRDGAGRVLGAGAVVQETTELERAEAVRRRLDEVLERERAVLRDVVQRAPAAIALLRGPVHRIALANARMRELVGEGDLEGRAVAEVLPEGVLEGLGGLLDEVHARGEALREVDVALPSGDPRAWDGRRFFSFTLDPVAAGPDGEAGVLVVAVETTDEVRRRALLQEELDSERAIAATLQRALLPRRLPDVPGLDLAARYEAAGFEVGGDFYDAAPVADGRWLVAVGDVCGKGPEAAALTAMARYTLRAEAAATADPAALLELLNAEVLRQVEPDVGGALRFITVALAAVELAGGRARVRLALAGHPCPVVVHAAGGATTVGEIGPPAGVDPHARYTELAVELGPGDLLLLYTDGVLDAHAPARRLEPADLAARLDAARPATATAAVDAVAAVVGEVPGTPRDDLAVLALRVTGDDRAEPGVSPSG